jgi:hypothetical protein
MDYNRMLLSCIMFQNNQSVQVCINILGLIQLIL